METIVVKEDIGENGDVSPQSNGLYIVDKQPEKDGEIPGEETKEVGPENIDLPVIVQPHDGPVGQAEVGAGNQMVQGYSEDNGGKRKSKHRRRRHRRGDHYTGTYDRNNCCDGCYCYYSPDPHDPDICCDRCDCCNDVIGCAICMSCCDSCADGPCACCKCIGDTYVGCCEDISKTLGRVCECGGGGDVGDGSGDGGICGSDCCDCNICSDDCCKCGDCNCSGCDCDCGGCDCDCGGCDCGNCDCGSCTIL